MSKQTPFTAWCRLCEEAWCSPDTMMSDAEFAARYYKQTGARIAVQRITQVRADAWLWIREQPSVEVGRMRL